MTFTSRSTHLVSGLPTSLGTMIVPITLPPAKITSSAPKTAATALAAVGTTNVGSRFLGKNLRALFA